MESAPAPPVNPSEYTAALVHEAVNKPTVLPCTYTILENIGDRISRLAPPRPAKSYYFQPKIPQPQPELNGTSSGTIEHQSSRVSASQPLERTNLEPSATTPVAAPSPAVEETPSQEQEARESVTTPVAVEEPVSETVKETPTVAVEPDAIAQPIADQVISESVEEAPTVAAEPDAIAQSAAAQVIEDNFSVEVESESEPILEKEEIEPASKKLSDGVQDETSTSPMVVSPPVANDEATPEEESVAVAETINAEEVAPTIAEPVDIDESTTSNAEHQLEENSQLTLEDTQTTGETNVEPASPSALAEREEEAPIVVQKPEPEQKSVRVEPPGTTDKDGKERTTIEVTCPKCESTRLRKNGHRQGKQRYVCKDCGKQFAIPEPTQEVKQPKQKVSSRVEVANTQSSELDQQLSSSSKRSGKNKKKAKAKGFGNSKGK
jgi:DNA-directed RNA polymerase subunit RPC12/RpoP